MGTGERASHQRPRSRAFGGIAKQRGVARALLDLACVRGNWNELIRHIIRVDAEVIRVERVSFWSLSDEPSAIHCDAGFVASPRTFEHGATLFNTDYPAYFKALLEARILNVEDVQSDDRTSELHEYFVARRISSMLDIPVWVGGRLAGVLCHEQVGGKRQWTTEEEDFAAGVGQVVSSALALRAETSAEAAARRASYLDNVSRQLNGSLDGRDIAARAARLLVPGSRTSQSSGPSPTARPGPPRQRKPTRARPTWSSSSPTRRPPIFRLSCARGSRSSFPR